MSSARKRVVLGNVEEVFNKKGGSKATAAFWAERIVNFGNTITREELGRIFDSLLEAFPDWEFHVDHIIEEGEWVALSATVTGTYRAAKFPPFADIEPKGQKVRWRHMHWFRVEGERIVEHFATRDDLGVRKQLTSAG